MKRQTLERHQVWLYLLAIGAGFALASAVPAVAASLEAFLWPALGVLLYATFTQVPLAHLPAAARDRRFVAAVLLGNFVLVPLLVAVLIRWLPAGEPALRLGVLLVLLVPCTDWFLTFAHLAGGDTRRAIAVTPINLLVQIALLPLYLWLFMGETFVEIIAAERLAAVFVTLILLPLLAAYLTERWVTRRLARDRVVARLGWLPVPMLALVVFLIAASQARAAADALHAAGLVIGLFAVYLVAAAVLGAALARVMRLPMDQARALIFSLGTRNSFVVLPLSLALSAEWQAATIVIVLQALVELFGMVAYLWVVPRFLAR